MSGPRWFDVSSMTGSGRGSKLFFGPTITWGGHPRTTVSSSRLSFGGDARGFLGAIFRGSSDLGKACSIVSTGGQKPANGTASSKRCATISMPSGSVSTRRSTALTSTPRAEKGGSGQRDWKVARRSNDEGPPDRRCPRLTRRLHAHRRSTPRQPLRSRAHRARSPTLFARRQGLRHERPPGGAS